MEGYTNVIGTPYDFDDLDIEGRVVDEWRAEDEERNRKKITGDKVPEIPLRFLLSALVKLDNGQSADVFSVTKKQDSEWYTCFVCSDTIVGPKALREHVDSLKHRTNMKIPVHPKAKFIKLDPKENMALEPGEPVPPGLEEVFIKNCIIQPKLDAYTSSPLIGLEFLLELTDAPLSPPEQYYCQLCEKIGSERNMFIHLTSIFHYMKYLSMYFPTVAKKLQSLPNRKMKKAFGLLVTEIVKDIETKCGRMKPTSETYANFQVAGRKSELQKIAYEKTHFSEKDSGQTFAEKATAENVERIAKESFIASQAVDKPEPLGTRETDEENKQQTTSLFNKNRISVDKKQLRSRDEEPPNSPDLEVVDVKLPTKSQDKRKRTRSRSLSSISSLSSSSSYSRNRRRHSRHHSRVHSRSQRKWSRSRSRSPGYRHRRARRSPSYGRGRHSPGRRSRDRSYERRRGRRDSRGNSPDSYRSRERTDRFGRSREKYRDPVEINCGDKYRRASEDEKDSPRPIGSEEKARWEKFREVLKEIESAKLEKLKYFEKNPEKHPQYPEEWKAFWNRRYNELQRSGVDPSKHDFKPEWISFWTKRMKELYEEDLGQAKDELRKKYDLPDDAQLVKDTHHTPWKRNQRRRSPGLEAVSPPTPEKKDVIADIKSTWKAFTGSDIKDAPKRPLSPWEDDGMPFSKRDAKRSPSPLNMNEKLLEDMPQRKTKTSSLIFVLRKLAVLEEQMGSLAPRVFELMQQSLAYEKIKEEASLDLLMESDNAFFLETTREKLIALLCAGVVPRNFVNTARSAIKHIDIALYLASKRERSLPIGALRPPVVGILPAHTVVAPSPYIEPRRSEPVVVPGVGQVDKVAIAQQIAAALVEQGKTNVTEDELEQLINAVVGMAEASANSSQPMTTANFLNQLQSMQKQTPVQSTQPEIPVSQPIGIASNIPTAVAPNPPTLGSGALKLLQSAYNEPTKTDQDSPKPDFVNISSPKPTPISDVDLAATLMKFNQTNKEDQSSFLQNLQISNPDMYKRLCPFIPPSSLPTSSEPTKRSPISISISKQRSEQKIKPLSSGRASPFSSRSGGANPTINEGIIVEDEDDIKDDVKVLGEVPKPKAMESNIKTSHFNFNSVDLDDDDDDDDYSYEDVYKAAQERLRQNQLAEDQESTQSTSKSSSGAVTGNDKLKEDSQTNFNNSRQTTDLTDSIPLNLNNQERKKVTNDNYQPQRPVGDNLKSQFPERPTPQPDYDQFDIASNIDQTIPYQPTPPVIPPPASTFNYQAPQPRSQFPDINQYPNNPLNSKPNNEYYDRSRPYPEETPNRSYYGETSYPSAQSSEMYNNPYSVQTTTGYGNYPGSYNDQYNRYKEPTYNSGNYQPPQPRPPLAPRDYPNHPQRYPSYPPY